MNKKTNGTLLFSLIFLFAAFAEWDAFLFTDDLQSKIFKKSEVMKQTEDWGSIFVYTDDSTSTYGTGNTLTAHADILPGEEIHPPHQHAEEEFLYVVEGEGTWSLNGEESNAKAGDLLYAAPWDFHGITNTGTDTLKFFIVKWNSKGVKIPAKPVHK